LQTPSSRQSHYQHPEIQHVFELIEKDQVTPEERARMFDEYGEEQIKQEPFEKGRVEGLKEADNRIKQAENKAKQAAEEKAKESARNLKELGVLTDEQIAGATGLNLETVKTLP